MTTRCPKCQYIRRPQDAQLHPELCPSCGIAYAKWLAKQEQASSPTQATPFQDDEKSSFYEWISFVPAEIDAGTFWGRVIIFGGFLLWSFYFISAGVDWEKIGGSFLHNVNLPFHEFGHVLFMPFGRFMTILGGSLFQVLMPLGLMIAFSWKQRDNFAAAIMLWWCGQNFIDVSPYINDARYRALPLVGGAGEESHDWGNLLTMMNALEKTHKIALTSFAMGTIIILLALAWAAYILFLQKKNLKKF